MTVAISVVVGRKKIAEFLGLSEVRINQLVKEEGMPQQARGKYSVPDCVKWYIAFKIDGGKKTKGSNDVNDARKKLYDEQVIKTQLETAKMRRESIPADEHLIDMNQLGVMFSSGLDSISGRLSAELAGMSDAAEISERITLEANSIRDTVADGIAAYSRSLSHG